MSFFRMSFPELESLPLEEQRTILERCLAAPSVRRLARQRLWSTRAAMLLLPIGFGLQFLRGSDGEVPKAALWVMLAIIPVVLIAVPALFFGYGRRIGVEMRRLVRRELEQHT